MQLLCKSADMCSFVQEIIPVAKTKVKMVKIFFIVVCFRTTKKQESNQKENVFMPKLF
jgi:hypothetical protein